MQELTVNKVRRIHDSGNEIEVPQALSLLELVATDNAKSRIVKNGNAPVVKEHVISQIEGAGELSELYSAFSKMRQRR